MVDELKSNCSKLVMCVTDFTFSYPSWSTWFHSDQFQESFLSSTYRTQGNRTRNPGYAQANMVEDIGSLLTAEMSHQANIAFIPHPYEAPAPLLAPPATAAHATTDTILQQVLAQNQELMKMLASNGNASNSNNKSCPRREPNTNPSLSKRTGQPPYPLPA